MDRGPHNRINKMEGLQVGCFKELIFLEDKIGQKIKTDLSKIVINSLSQVVSMAHLHLARVSHLCKDRINQMSMLISHKLQIIHIHSNKGNSRHNNKSRGIIDNNLKVQE